MQVFADYLGLPADAKGAVTAIGNFDGLHLGHRAVLDRTRERARAAQAPFGVITFEPHPRRYFRPSDPPFRLTPADIKRRMIEALGCDAYYELPFDAPLAGLTADEFVARVLASGLGIRHIVVGDGFVFGKARSGSVPLLEHLADEHGFEVSIAAPVRAPDGHSCSSTRIRDLLAKGDPESAAVLLGRNWSIAGRVAAGDQRGRGLGFPTANLELGDYLRPAFGVYAVRAALEGDGGSARIGGVANLGVRPTVGGDKTLLEVHLFDFARDIYGRTIDVELLRHLRPERRFAGLEALKAQIATDSAQARAFLAGAP